MIGDVVVVDGVVHGYNWTPENFAVPQAEAAARGSAGFHRFLSRDDVSQLTEAEFLRDWSVEELEAALFFESSLDVVAHHGTPIWDFFKDGHSDTEKGFALKERHPDRVIVYGAVNPFEGEKALEDIDRLADRGCTALKVYAARYENGRTITQNLDDPEFGYPFIQKAIDTGMKVIATHKAIPFGPVRPEPYGMADIPEVCAVFPEMQFEIVHAGMAFVEDTALLLRHPNVWLNLEVSAALIFKAPRRFAEFMGAFMAAADRIIFATGCGLVHPQPSIEAFMDFQLPDDLVDGWGYQQITPEIRRGIMGENHLRLHGIDPDELVARLADDEISRYRADHGLAEPWSHLRGAAVAAV